jgi:hypothetical protein
MVNNNMLFQKMDTYGIRGTAHEWFVSYLKNRQQLVQINCLDVNVKSNKNGRKKKKSNMESHRVPFY